MEKKKKSFVQYLPTQTLAILFSVLLVSRRSDCHVKNYKQATVCDGDAEAINCPRTQAIHILQTFYGKWRNHDCHGILPQKDNIPTCNVERAKTTAVIRDICQGRNECNLFSDNSIFGEPCPNIKKYLYVTYFCLPAHGPSRSPGSLSPKTQQNSVSRQRIEKGAVKAAAICNGENKMLYCKPSEKIKVNYAFYGKRNGHDCHGPLPYRDESPTCSALDAKYNVQSFCEGKPTCMLKADDATYGRALCPNVNKYLYVTYYCEDSPSFKERSALLSPAMDLEEDAVSRSLIRRLPDQIPKTFRVCNGQRETITCSNPTKTMRIYKAFYGKKTGEDCRGRLPYKDSVPNCIHKTAFDSVHYLCNGRHSCDLVAESALFGEDPCPGVNKYLEVKYSC